jgi:homoserine kinase
MPATLRLIAALRREGMAAVVSGAGPTVLTLAAAGQVAAVRQIVEANSEAFKTMELIVDQGGVQAS